MPGCCAHQAGTRETDVRPRRLSGSNRPTTEVQLVQNQVFLKRYFDPLRSVTPLINRASKDLLVPNEYFFNSFSFCTLSIRAIINSTRRGIHFTESSLRKSVPHHCAFLRVVCTYSNGGPEMELLKIVVLTGVATSLRPTFWQTKFRGFIKTIILISASRPD